MVGGAEELREGRHAQIERIQNRYLVREINKRLKVIQEELKKVSSVGTWSEQPSSRVMSNQNESSRVWSSQVEPRRVKSSHVTSTQVRSMVRSSQVRNTVPSASRFDSV